jgi:hypothetical protein
MPIKLDIFSPLDGLKNLYTYFTEVQNRVSDWTGAADGVGDIVREDYRLKFESAPASERGGTIWGGAYWKPLSEGYMLSHPHRRSGNIHKDTLATMRSFIQKGAVGNLVDVSRDRMEFGSSLAHVPELEARRKIAYVHLQLTVKVAAYMARWYLMGEKADVLNA